MRLLPESARFVPSSGTAPKLVLFDVMDTLVADPFYRGFHADLFGLESIKALFEVKDRDSFISFETGEISEQDHFATYFVDRRPVDGERIKSYMCERYQWLEGMFELCSELQDAGVPMAAFSNYPAPWAPLVEEAVGLSQLVPWGFVSGEVGCRKPASQAFEAALAAVGRSTSDVVFVDDSETNVEAAKRLGIAAIRFESAAALRPALRQYLTW